MQPLDLFSIGSWAIFDHIFKMSSYPQNGETITLDMPVEHTQKTYFGDCSANIAAVAAGLGLQAGLGMVVGDDFISSGYRDHLSTLGVDLSGVEIIPEKTSGHNYLYFDQAGDGFCFSHQGVAINQSGWEPPKETLHRSKTVVLNEMFSNYTLRAARIAHAAGIQVVINGMIGTAGSATAIKKFLSTTDILFIAHSELANLLVLLQLVHPGQLLDQGLTYVFATQGKKGSLIYSRTGIEEVPIVPVNNVVDPTGAGDSYCAGTITGLIKGFSPSIAAQIGAVVSSFIIQEWGCQTNLPSWDHVIERHKKYFGKDLNI